MHSKIVEGRNNIETGKELLATKLRHDFLNQGYWVAILLDEIVKLSVVDAESKTIILLLSKQDWRGVGRGTRLDESLFQVLVEVLFYLLKLYGGHAIEGTMLNLIGGFSKFDSVIVLPMRGKLDNLFLVEDIQKIVIF